MITDPAQIREKLEQLTKEAEERNVELKRQADELQARLDEQNAGPEEAPFEFGDNVKLRVGISKQSKVVRSNASYDMVLSAIQTVVGQHEKYFASKDDQGRLIWLRTSFAMNFLFTSYFAEGWPAVELDAIAPEAVQPVEKFNLRKELPYRDGQAVFKVECAGPEDPLIYLTFPSNMTLEAANQHLGQIFGKITSLRFVDEAEDVVTVDSTESWDYALATSLKLSKLGRFPLLLIQTS
jgi:hypothetical protein